MNDDSETHLNNSLEKIASGASIGFIGLVVGMVFGYLSRMILARFLGPSEYGLISIGFTVLTIAVMFSWAGLPVGVERYVSFFKGKEDNARIKGTIVSALKINTLLSITIALIIFAGARWISVNIFHEPALIPILRIFSIAIPFHVVADDMLAAIIGFQNMKYKVYVEHIFKNGFKLILIVSFLLVGFGITGATWGWVISIICMPFLAFYIFNSKIFPKFTSVKSIPIDKELFSYSWPLLFSGVLQTLMIVMDTFMLGYLSTSSSVGIYNAAQPTANLIPIVLLSFGTIFTPIASELYARDKIDVLKNTYTIVTKWILIFVLPAFLLMSLFSTNILRILFGEEYISGNIALIILAFGYFITSIVGPTTKVLQIYGWTRIFMICAIVGLVINIVLNAFLIPIYGVSGAAIATSVSVALTSILQLFFIYYLTKLYPFKLSYVKPILASIVSISIIYALVKWAGDISLVKLVILSMLFISIYYILLRTLNVFEKEDEAIIELMKNKVGY